MDIYDPQTLGIMVFGGFMVISAVGIALVSTFSMKETSYEEALAKQRRELGKMQSVRSEKKKKDKVSEKKSRGKKKEEKPNGKIPDQEKPDEAAEADSEADPVIEPAVAPAASAAPAPTPEPAPAVEVKPAAASMAAETQLKVAAEPSSVAEPSPKDKKKKKVAKVEPASTQPAPTVSAAPVKSSAAPALTQAHVSAPTKATTPSSAPAKSATLAKSSPVSTKSAPASAPASASAKSAPTQAKAAPVSAKSMLATTKSAPATTKSTPAPSKTAPVLEAVTKDVPVMAVPPVGSQQAPAAAAKSQEPKKKASKKKTESVFASAVAAGDSADAPLYLPYKALVSTISSMMFSEGEAHRLIEILSEKVGIIQDTWHTASQKGDPVAMLKKQLEEKEKQLATEQEDASAVKNRLRELTKELSAEKSKVASVETRLSSQLSKREQEMIALQARMQASYQDHVAQTQRLNAKILSLQDQLEKGPNAQLARLQQENSILRDALNQATSQAESKQNAELAKLRQECTKLTKELGEKTESLLADEQIRKGLEAKVSTTEKQLSVLQGSHAEAEQALQKKVEEVCEELRAAQTKNNSLQATLEKAQQDSSSVSECQARIGMLEAEIREHSAQVDALNAQLKETQAEKNQLVQQVTTINSLLEASQNKKEEDNKDDKEQADMAELEHLKLCLQERDSQLSSLHEELKQLQTKQEAAENTIAELEQRNKSEDNDLITSLQDELKNLREETAQLKNTTSDTSTEMALLKNSLAEKDALVASLQEELREAKEKTVTDTDAEAQLAAFQTETKDTLQLLFPQIPVEAEQSNWLQIFTQKAQETLSHESRSSTALPELLEKLKEAEESHGSLQAECEQYRTVLAETEGMLKHLQNSVEEEELVWKSKMANVEEQLKEALQKVITLEAENQSVEQLKEQMMLLEAQLEKQSDNLVTSEEMEQLKVQLSEYQSQLDLAQKEARAHKEELEQVKEQLGKITKQAQGEQNGPAETEPSQVQNDLSRTTEKLHGEAAQKQQLSEEFEQAQKTVVELQAQLDLLKVSAESPQSDTEDVAQLKERLEKEKKLSKDLGQAATKLQQLLKATQDQLTKERETVRTLQDHLDGKGEFVELKEGTSV
ncbi:ribosome-binding protein 1a isoform X3 [Melanotaenia boesemani]|uniref:ribosome-binding protein 1a isoform X3 n=1 Tax=Melanotaenia boesemani TaxID=1250792 RepID=UPI001C058958|nr:ribosome-binding protein 1a isoform X3 [Melanotaenia boesemani]